MGFIRSTDRYSTSKVGVTRQVAKEGKKSRALRCPIYCHKYSGGEGKSKKVTPYGCTKNGNHFQIIFAHHIFLSSNTGLLPKAPQISSLEVSEIAYLNVSLKCKVGVRPSDCWDNSLRWYFNNNSEKLESGEKYNIQERKTNTRCKTDFILTIINVTEADEGKYKCQWLCENDYPSFSRSSIIQLKVFPPSEEGTDTPVISKGIVLN